MGIETGINLITAALDLQLVRLLRAATADDAEMLARVQRKHDPVPEILPRKRIEPTPRFEPRPVVHPTPRFEPRPVITPSPAESAPTPDSVRGASHSQKSHLPPPCWKALPSEIPSEPAQTVKLIVHRPDIISKGSLIDLFI